MNCFLLVTILSETWFSLATMEVYPAVGVFDVIALDAEGGAVGLEREALEVSLRVADVLVVPCADHERPVLLIQLNRLLVRLWVGISWIVTTARAEGEGCKHHKGESPEYRFFHFVLILISLLFLFRVLLWLWLRSEAHGIVTIAPNRGFEQFTKRQADYHLVALTHTEVWGDNG